MPNVSKTYIVNDQPTETDALDFTPYVETLADIIQTGNTPLTIGVFGTWGSGKTSLMKMVKKQLPNDFTVAWFDAWKYDKEETLWRAFLLSVLTAVRKTIKEGQSTEDLEYLETMLYRAVEIEKAGGVTIDLAKLGGAVAKGGVQLALSFIPGGAVLSEFVKKVQELGAEALTNESTEAIQRERTKIHIEQVRFLEQFQDKFRTLVEQHISNKGKRLVVFVDDLDRCLPEKAIEVLEAIKLFLDAENCVFVLGLDQEVIARGIEMKYKELGARQDSNNQQRFTVEGMRYLEKIIQLPFQIPPVEQNDMGDFVHGLNTEWPHEECPKVFAEGLGDNPRQIKRTINTFLTLWNLAEKRKNKLQGIIKPVRLAKLVAIQMAAPYLYTLLKEQHTLLRDIETYLRIEVKEKVEKVQSKSPDVDKKIESYVQLSEDLLNLLAKNPVVRQILLVHPADLKDANFVDIPYDELHLYFSLTRRIETVRPQSNLSHLIFEPQMISIPEGPFLMGTSAKQLEYLKDETHIEWLKWELPQHRVYLSEFYIGKYPITNREYQVFIQETTHIPPKYWIGDQYPLSKEAHPVVNVSCQDAKAYCEWLSNKTGRLYRLPTEAEWEKAAKGTDERIWPWGNDFYVFANTREAKIKDTSPVGQFSPRGDSPNGCADMVGNVWEWCLDLFHEAEYHIQPTDIKNPKGPIDGSLNVIRGGSFFYKMGETRCSRRLGLNPTLDSDDIGFRVALLDVDS